MTPQANFDLTEFELRIVKLVAAGLTDEEIFAVAMQKSSQRAGLKLTPTTATSIVNAIRNRTKMTRVALAFYAISQMQDDERAKITGKAQATRQKLIKIMSLCRATYAVAIATPDTCDLSDKQVGDRCGPVTSQTVNKALAPLIEVAGSKLWLQVTLYLAQINPDDWDE